MQIMAEALGLMLPGTALMPATSEDLQEAAYQAGTQVMQLARKGIQPPHLNFLFLLKERSV